MSLWYTTLELEQLSDKWLLTLTSLDNIWHHSLLANWHLKWLIQLTSDKNYSEINKQLPPKITLPENPTINIKHYYRYLTVTPMIDENQLILMIKIPLVVTDSTLILYKTYNLPIFHPDIGQSLAYELQGSNLAITQDRNYVTILTESEFIQCTLAQGHFCRLNTPLYHIDYSKWCLAAMFLKDNDRINKYCTLTMTNIYWPSSYVSRPRVLGLYQLKSLLKWRLDVLKWHKINH